MSVSMSIGRPARLLRILLHLQSGQRLNAKGFADSLNVCERTIYRDLNLIRTAGLEVFYDEESDAYRLVCPSQDAAPPSFEEGELARLACAAQLSALRHLPEFSDALQRTIDKLLLHSPFSERHAAQRLMNSCVVREAQTADTRVIDRIFESIRQRRTAWVRLQGADETILSPYRVVVGPDGWEVTGHSSRLDDVETLAVDQIVDVRLTADSYAVPREYRRPVVDAESN